MMQQSFDILCRMIHHQETLTVSQCEVDFGKFEDQGDPPLQQNQNGEPVGVTWTFAKVVPASSKAPTAALARPGVLPATSSEEAFLFEATVSAM